LATGQEQVVEPPFERRDLHGTSEKCAKSGSE
jgi:hypothetical protein